MNRLTIISALLLVAALLFNAMLEQEEVQPKEQIWGDYEPDYTAHQLYSRNYDEEGKLSSIVYAEKMESYPDLEMTIFTHPEVTLFDKTPDKAPAWRVFAAEGSHFTQKEQLQLRGEVTIKAKDPNSQVRTITTPSLVLEIGTNQMHTEDSIVAEGPKLQMKGKGLKANLNSEHIEILQQVEAFYENSQSN